MQKKNPLNDEWKRPIQITIATSIVAALQTSFEKPTKSETIDNCQVSSFWAELEFKSPSIPNDIFVHYNMHKVASIWNSKKIRESKPKRRRKKIATQR